MGDKAAPVGMDAPPIKWCEVACAHPQYEGVSFLEEVSCVAKKGSQWKLAMSGVCSVYTGVWMFFFCWKAKRENNRHEFREGPPLDANIVVPHCKALLQVRGLTSKTLESSWHRVLAMENSFRIYKMNGDIIEVQTATCIVRDIKEALERSSGISASDVGLLVDGCELRNNASVSPGVRDLFLVVHNSLRAIAQDFVINTQCAYGSYGSCGTACHSGPQERLATDQEVAQMSHLANFRMLGLEEAREQILGVWLRGHGRTHTHPNLSTQALQTEILFSEF